MKKTFFVTTPIYYTNWVPHIGHSYASLIADVAFSYKKINWFDVKFSTWVDENSQKAVLKAEELWMQTQEYLDMMVKKHKEVWDWLGISYTDFIRTTEKRHHEFVRKVLQKSFDAGDIYEWIYEWLYCVWCESFKKEDDLIEKDGKKVCPDHLTEPQKLKEKNYFFRLSKYQDKILEFYEKNPEFVVPRDRYNEVIAFVKRWLEDFSVSRETNKFWIKLPFAENQVTYVWYDALFNYITVCQNGDERFWPANLHVVWKDIIRFHAIYWPAMLMSTNYELPEKILTTWYFTIDWQKISKSLWNVIDPVEFSAKYSKDLLLLYLLSSFNIWQDWDFDQKQAILTYNAKLANNLWNLLNRAVVLTMKLELPNWFEKETFDKNILKILENYEAFYKKSFEKYELKSVLDSTFKFLDDLNLFVTEKEPWKLMKSEENLSEAKNILFTVCESLRQVALNLYPFFPEKMWKLFETLWLQNYSENLEGWKFVELKAKKENFKITEKPEILFEKFEI